MKQQEEAIRGSKVQPAEFRSTNWFRLWMTWHAKNSFGVAGEWRESSSLFQGKELL